MNRNNKVLLLLSARTVPPELRTDFGNIPSGMVPLNSRPALHHIAEPYVEHGFDVIIAVHEGAEMIESYVSRCPELKARTVDVGQTDSIAETLAVALHHLEDTPDLLVVNFADTFVGDEVLGSDAICYAETEDLYRWTAFKTDENGRITSVLPKDHQKDSQEPLPVFVGVFAFERADRMRDLLDQHIGRGRGDEPFWNALVQYHNELPDSAKALRWVTDWRDFGHLDRYYATQRCYFLNKRFFNSMSIDLGRGVIRKASTHADKLALEVNWYRALPVPLQYLGPRVFGYTREPEVTTVEMEFYGYPALNDVYLYGEWDVGVWAQVLAAIGAAVDGMQSHACSSSFDQRQAALRSMYVEKTIERLRSVVADTRFAALTGETVRINGQLCPGLLGCMEVLPLALESAGVLEPCDFTIIHGDLCLSNILFDRRSGFVRLIDPRGSFGAAGVYGDPRYDLAKLSHSFQGDYDFLLNGLFDLDIEGANVEYTVYHRPHHHRVRDLFSNWLLKRNRRSLRQIRLIESLLFLSMVPLHSDRPRSQAAFLARGLELFSLYSAPASTQSGEETYYATQAAGHCHHDGR